MDDDIYEIVLRDAYFRWLCHFIGFDDIGYSSCRHCLLLTYLYSMDFYIMDDVEGNEQNRIIDATDLKVEFCETHPEIDPDTMFENDPSVLEVIVALARRIILHIGSGKSYKISVWIVLRTIITTIIGHMTMWTS